MIHSFLCVWGVSISLLNHDTPRPPPSKTHFDLTFTIFFSLFPLSHNGNHNNFGLFLFDFIALFYIFKCSKFRLILGKLPFSHKHTKLASSLAVYSRRLWFRWNLIWGDMQINDPRIIKSGEIFSEFWAT